MAIVAIPSEPGESIRRDMLPFVVAMRARFKVDVTDGYSPASSGKHSPTGDHPKGLGLDVVPDRNRGGTWDDVDDAVAWGKQNLGDGKLFRWIGYNGVLNHGRGHHAHFSFNDDAADLLRRDDGDSDDGDGDGGGGGGGGVFGVLGVIPPIVGPINPLNFLEGGKDAGETAARAAGGLAGELLSGLADILGEEGARVLLYVALVGGGMTLTGLGISRASGVRAGGVQQLAMMAATRGAGGKAKAAA